VAASARLPEIDTDAFGSTGIENTVSAGAALRPWNCFSRDRVHARARARVDRPPEGCDFSAKMQRPEMTDAQAATVDFLWLQAVDLAVSISGGCGEPAYGERRGVLTMEVPTSLATGAVTRHRWEIRPDGTYRGTTPGVKRTSWLSAVSAEDFFEFKRLDRELDDLLADDSPS